MPLSIRYYDGLILCLGENHVLLQKNCYICLFYCKTAHTWTVSFSLIILQNKCSNVLGDAYYK